MNEYRLRKFGGSFFLCGFMASGKSTIGKRVAKILERPFKDLDEEIVAKEGKSIKSIFDEEGEAYFREKEWETLLNLTRTFKGVISLGGGALHNQQVVDHLKLHGILIYMKLPIESIVDRVLKNTSRPIVLNEQGKLKSRETLFTELKALYSSRKEHYEQAQIKLEGLGNEKKNIQAQQLVEKLKRYV